MMNYSECMVKRRSFHSFLPDELPSDIIEGLVDFLSSLTPPEEKIDWNFDTLPYSDLAKICSREPLVKAPHYLILRSDREYFSLQNMGYIGQYAALYLTGAGIATLWQTSIKINYGADFPGSLPYVASIGFGMSDEPFRASANEADRLAVDKLFYGQYDKLMPIARAVRLAPSSGNSQTCICVCEDNKRIHLYRKKPYFPNPIKEFDRSIDCGAVLAHIDAAAREMGLEPRFVRPSASSHHRKGYKYQASILLD